MEATEQERSDVRKLVFHGTQLVSLALITLLLSTKVSGFESYTAVLIMLFVGVHLFTKIGRSFLVKYANPSLLGVVGTILLTLGVGLLYLVFLAVQSLLLNFATFDIVDKIVTSVGVGTLIIGILAFASSQFTSEGELKQ